MKSLFIKVPLITIILVLTSFTTVENNTKPANDTFQGQAIYFSKSTMELGRWGARLSKEQKKQVQARLKNRLEKTYVLNFDKTTSTFDEEEKLDAISGATDSWGKNFSQGEQFKNIKENILIQSQEFYGKQFLVKDKLLDIEWKMLSETKQIGQYMCLKATAQIPTADLQWYNFSWSELRQQSNEDENASEEIPMTTVEAWYTPQIPVSHGPAEFWGLPGLILEVSSGNTTMLCSKIVMNPKETLKIEPPKKGKEITKKAYKETITKKMMEMRNNRGRRRS